MKPSEKGDFDGLATRGKIDNRNCRFVHRFYLKTKYKENVLITTKTLAMITSKCKNHLTMQKGNDYNCLVRIICFKY